MNRRNFLKAAGLATATPALSTSVASSPLNSTLAQADQDDQIDIDGGPSLSNEQLTQRLALLARNDENDRMDLTQIGTSAGRNDPIWEVQIGEGDTSVHIISQIHGDEPAGTEALLIILRRLVDGNSELVDSILSNLSLTIVPRANPDGAMYTEDTNDDGQAGRVGTRSNSQPWRETHSYQRPYYHTEELPGDSRGGYDMNRDFNINPDFISKVDDSPEMWSNNALNIERDGHTLSASGIQATPAVGAITRSFLRADPDYAKTLHHQGVPLDPDTGEPTILSVMASYGPSYAEQAPFGNPEEDETASFVNPFVSEETSERSIRLNEVAAQALEDYTGPWDHFATGTRYGYTTLWGSYLDALPPLTDAAGMLYEIPGQSDSTGGRAYYMKVETARTALLNSFATLAQDPMLSNTGIDTSEYFDRPLSEDPEDGRGTPFQTSR